MHSSSAGHNANGEARKKRSLCAVLLNPTFSPRTSISRANVILAASSLGFGAVNLVNLVQLESRDAKELALKAVDEDVWLRSRPALADALWSADDIVFAWGASRLAGPANRFKEEQVRWTVAQAALAGHSQVLLMDGSPRHPSRWRQYVGPQKGRVVGATLEDRFRKVLRSHSIDLLQGSSGANVRGVQHDMRSLIGTKKKDAQCDKD